MKYSFSKLSFEQVYQFLLETDNEFAIPLSSKVNLKDYAKKLSDFSHFAYCTDENKIIGMISCYTNNPPLGYISNVCVKSAYQRQGVFNAMFAILIDSLKELEIKTLRLEVDNKNTNAQNVYLRKGFVFGKQASENSKYMELQIQQSIMTECERIIKEGILPESFFEEEVRCDFLVTKKRKKIWAVELDLYLEFARICEKHGLKYFAMYGSILGAIRHNGYIPWDDDFDVCMFRDDYEKLCKIYAKEFTAPYFLQVAETDPGYYVSFAKLRNSNTTSISMPFKNSMINQGIAIDIFPLDYSVPSECEEISFQINESIMKCSSYMKKGSEEYLNERQLANYKKYQTADPYGEYMKIQTLASRVPYSDYVSNAILTVYHWKKHTFPLHCFETSVEKDFEGVQIKIPCGWKEILENCYGDYMKFPPIEQRGAWHSNVFWNPDIPYEKYKVEGGGMEDLII